MRTIDADALLTAYDAKHKGPPGNARRLIETAPTIDAIPVGWLIDRANDPERAPLYRRYAQMLYEEWQKNRRRDSG